MKKLAQRLLPVTLLLAVLVTACTTDEGTPAPNFPDPVEDFVEPNSTYTLHLSPNQEWMVSIPSTASDFWGIRNGEQISYSIGGPAGDVTVEIVCLAEMNDLADHEVEVSMRMGGETRVIATLTLSRGEALLNIVPAKIAEDSDGHEYFQTPAESTGFLYEYGEPLAEGAAVPMLWDATRNGYVSYIRVESNFSYGTNIEAAGLRLTELQSPSASGRYSEYEVFCSQVNLGETPVSYSFDITSEVEGFEEVAVSVNAPQFVPVLEVRATVPDDDNRNFQTPSGDDSPYNWLYSETPLTLSESADGTGAGNVDLLWRPSATITEVDAYILVKANFNLTVAGAGWVSVGDGTVVEETSDNYETETYYRIYVAPSDIVTAGDESTVTINFGDETDNVYSRTFNVTSPDITDIFYVNSAPDFTFDAEGGYQADEMGMSTNATVEITSAAEVVVKEFSMNNDGYYQDDDMQYGSYMGLGWVSHTYAWAGGDDKIQTNTLTVTVTANDRQETRSGFVMAFPQSVWADILTEAGGEDGIAYLLVDDNNNINPDYIDYVVAYIEQEAPAGAISPYMLDEYWSQTGATFESLPAYDDIYGAGLDGITSAVPGYVITYVTDVESMGGYELGTETEFDVNVDFDSWDIMDFDTGKTISSGEQSTFWAQLKKSQYSDSPSNRYYIGVQPDAPADGGLVYFLLKNQAGAYVAIIKFSYEPASGGDETEDINLSLTSGGDWGYTLTELEPNSDDRPSGWETQPCYMLTFTGTDAGMAVIAGFPETATVESFASWVTVSSLGAGQYAFMFDDASASGDAVVTVYDDVAVLRIVCRVIAE